MTKAIDLIGLLTLLTPPGSPSTEPGRGPTELRMGREPDEMGRRRSLWCPAYELCLDAARVRGWRSWTCESCSLFRHAERFRAQAAERVHAARRTDLPPDDGPAPSLP
jgi:hypothetical protein